jgi:hypothetical protein
VLELDDVVCKLRGGLVVHSAQCAWFMRRERSDDFPPRTQLLWEVSLLIDLK